MRFGTRQLDDKHSRQCAKTPQPKWRLFTPRLGPFFNLRLTRRLGIPGSAATVFMLAAMILHGVNPGPFLFIMDPTMVNTIFAAMIFVNVLMILAGISVAQMFSTLMRMPPAILAAFIIVRRLIGAYGARNNIFDVYVCIVFGIIGWGMKRVGFSPAPLILCSLAERYFITPLANFGQDYIIFVTRPSSGTIIAMTVLFMLWSPGPSVRCGWR